MSALHVERIEFHSAKETPNPSYAAGRAIRNEVFVQEQGVPDALEFDGLDDQTEHFIAWYSEAGCDPLACGVARLRRAGRSFKAERVAVRAARRRQGIGRALMRALEARASEFGAQELTLHAQVDVIPFYENLGYATSGPVFKEAGIDHRSMRKPLAAAPSPTRR